MENQKSIIEKLTDKIDELEIKVIAKEDTILKRNFSKERITLDLNAKNQVLSSTIEQKDHLSDLNSKRLGLY